MTEDQRLRGGLPITAGVMTRAIVDLCGHAFLEGCVNRTKIEFAKKGVLGWELRDTNILMDVVPAPDPYVGEWCFRLKTTEITASGDVHVCEFYLPQSEIPRSKQRSNN